MRKRDDKKNRRDIVNAFSMILQIGLAMMVCLGISLGIGYYLDKLFHTRFILVIMMFVGILASLRSMLVLTGVYKPGAKKVRLRDADLSKISSADSCSAQGGLSYTKKDEDTGEGKKDEGSEN